MAHIHIGPDGMTVDGTRVEVMADDLDVDLSTTPPTVRCTIPADTVEIELPEAVLTALREQPLSAREEIRLVRERLEDIIHAFDPLAPERTGAAVARAINSTASRATRGGAK